MARRHRNGWGSVRKLPSGRYQASYAGPLGRRHKAPTTFEARIDAQGWLASQHRSIQNQTWQPPSAAKPKTDLFAGYAEAWLSSRDLKPNTVLHYRWALDSHILPTFGDLPVRKITPATVREWHGSLVTGATAKAHCYALLKSILSSAVDDELITVNPCRMRGASKVKRAREIRPATLAELETITRAMPEQMRLLVELSAWCALRFGEVTELRRKDIDLPTGILRIRRGVTRPGGTIVVESPKTVAGSRNVHVPPHLIPMVKRHLNEHAQIGRDGLLFYGVKDGRQLSHGSLLHHFRKAATTAGRPDLTPHALRHTGAVLAARSGATLAELMSRLGHTTPQMAMLYQHAAADRDKVIAENLSALVGARGVKA